MKISTNWLKDFVQLSPPLERIADRLTMAGLEVKKIEPAPVYKDTILEIEITSNRPDWLSHFGVAREIAAVENISLKIPPIEKQINRSLPPGWRLNLKEQEGCPYYTGVYFEGVAVSNPTPDFMRDRLQACGIRPVSLIVDITNYILLETGQPLHAFDADTLRGQEIQIRRAKTKESFLAINGTEYILSPTDLVIADSEMAVALAGVMGGKETEITERTRNIFLESAFFHPRWVRLTSRKLGLGSESSYRFERRVDPEGVDYARDRAAMLIQLLAKPRFISGVLKAGERPHPPREMVHLSLSEIEKNLGLSIKPHQVSSALTRLHFDVKQDSAGNWKVRIPSFRPDVTEAVDLVEETARIYGYENIPETLPSRAPLEFHPNLIWKCQQKARNLLTGFGFYETVTFSLIAAAGFEREELKCAVSIKNPQNQDLVWMRPVLWPSLLQVIQRNQDLGTPRAAFFEIASVYTKGDSKNPMEIPALGIALHGMWKEKNWLDTERPATFYDLKGILQEFLIQMNVHGFSFEPFEAGWFVSGIAEKITVGGEMIGFLGEIEPQRAKLWDLESGVFYGQFSFEKIAKLSQTQKAFHELPKFPAIERDLAVVVEESVKAGQIENEIRKMGQGLIVQTKLFDIFRGGRIPKGQKNLAFRVTYQSRERTLVSEEIQKLHSKIAETIAAKFQASFQ